MLEGKTVIRRTFNTPVGSIYEDEWRDPGTGGWKMDRSWRDVTPWLLSRRGDGCFQSLDLLRRVIGTIRMGYLKLDTVRMSFESIAFRLQEDSRPAAHGC